MSQSGGFDMSKMSTASKILFGAGVLYIIDLFLPWQERRSRASASRSRWTRERCERVSAS